MEVALVMTKFRRDKALRHTAAVRLHAIIFARRCHAFGDETDDPLAEFGGCLTVKRMPQANLADLTLISSSLRQDLL